MEYYRTSQQPERPVGSIAATMPPFLHATDTGDGVEFVCPTCQATCRVAYVPDDRVAICTHGDEKFITMRVEAIRVVRPNPLTGQIEDDPDAPSVELTRMHVIPMALDEFHDAVTAYHHRRRECTCFSPAEREKARKQREKDEAKAAKKAAKAQRRES